MIEYKSQYGTWYPMEKNLNLVELRQYGFAVRIDGKVWTTLYGEEFVDAWNKAEMWEKLNAKVQE